MRHQHITHLLTAVAIASGLCVASTGAQAQVAFPAANANVSPVSDSFYKSPSAAELNAKAPGTLIRYRSVDAKDYTSSQVAKAYQVMFRSTGQAGNATAVVATVLIPPNAPATGRKLMSYQSFYDSLTQTCTPSYLTAQGKLFEAGNVQPALAKGVVVIMADYEGLDNQWIAGFNTAHGVLDGIRAALKFQPTGLNAASPVAMMGFSGGGHATAWAAEMAPEYAPELNIVGAAMGGIPVNPGNVARKVDGGFFAGVYFGATVGLQRAYNIDPTKYATTAGVTMIKDIGGRCLLGMFEGQSDMLLKYAFQKGTKYLKDANFLDLPEIKAILDENTLGSRTPSTNLYVYEGTNDEIMPIADVDNLVAGYCNAGLKVQYNRTSGDHLLMAISPTAAMNWSLDRLDGKVAPTNCK